MTVENYLHGHRERLKERLRQDTSQLADYEIMELLLGYVLLRRDTKPLAKALLERFGGLRGVMDARGDEFGDVKGYGPALELFRTLLRELMARYEEAPVRRKEALCTPEVVARMARHRLAGCTHEELWVALTDHGNRLITWKCLRRGTVAQVHVIPRDVLEVSLLHKASNIILVHNHPGGNPKPSGADLHLTRELARLAPALGLTLTDHLVVTEDACYSLCRDGLL